jgi:hypothetical protein
MDLNDAQRKQLDEIVTKMDADGAPTEEIQAVVNDFKTKMGGAVGSGSKPPANDAHPPQEPSKPSSGGYIPPGVIGGTGAALASASPYIRTGVNYVAQQAAEHPNTAAAATAAIASHVTGIPWWEGMVGSRLLGLGKALKPAAQAVADATSTAIPRVAGRFAALPAGRAAANTAFKHVIPGIGQALMALDAARGGYAVGTKLDQLTGASNKIGETLGPLYQDSLLQELIERNRK